MSLVFPPPKKDQFPVLSFHFDFTFFLLLMTLLSKVSLRLWKVPESVTNRTLRLVISGLLIAMFHSKVRYSLKTIEKAIA